MFSYFYSGCTILCSHKKCAASLPTSPNPHPTPPLVHSLGLSVKGSNVTLRHLQAHIHCVISTLPCHGRAVGSLNIFLSAMWMTSCFSAVIALRRFRGWRPVHLGWRRKDQSIGRS